MSLKTRAFYWTLTSWKKAHGFFDTSRKAQCWPREDLDIFWKIWVIFSFFSLLAKVTPVFLGTIDIGHWPQELVKKVRVFRCTKTCAGENYPKIDAPFSTFFWVIHFRVIHSNSTVQIDYFHSSSISYFSRFVELKICIFLDQIFTFFLSCNHDWFSN